MFETVAVVGATGASAPCARFVTRRYVSAFRERVNSVPGGPRGRYATNAGVMRWRRASVCAKRNLDLIGAVAQMRRRLVAFERDTVRCEHQAHVWPADFAGHIV